MAFALADDRKSKRGYPSMFFQLLHEGDHLSLWCSGRRPELVEMLAGRRTVSEVDAVEGSATGVVTVAEAAVAARATASVTAAALSAAAASTAMSTTSAVTTTAATIEAVRLPADVYGLRITLKSTIEPKGRGYHYPVALGDS